MPSARLAPYRLFRAMQGTTRAYGHCAWISPGQPALVWRDRHRDARILLANQNLLHLVLKCLMSTKHSGATDAWQALFHAQEGGRKTTTKTAAWIRVCRISKHLPPPVHRVVHSDPADERLRLRCSFATWRLRCPRRRVAAPGRARVPLRVPGLKRWAMPLPRRFRNPDGPSRTNGPGAGRTAAIRRWRPRSRLPPARPARGRSAARRPAAAPAAGRERSRAGAPTRARRP